MITLDSVAAQQCSCGEWECVVVDNNSSDNTRERVERFTAEHPELNLRYIFEQRQGLSHARNTGIAASVGDIIAFIDDDERIVEEFVEAYIKLFDSYPDAMAAGGKIIADYPTGRPRWMSHYPELPIANPMDFGEEVKPFPKSRIPGGGNMAMRRRVFETIGVFDTSLGRTGKKLIGGEESDLFERMAKFSMKCYYVPRAVMYHIIPAEKLTAEYFERLTYNIGISQHVRATLHGRRMQLYLSEIAKWFATLLLCLVHRPAQSHYLLKLRYNISRGVFQRER
jgi:glycosyltransferase involved in cell wall biosynthesis